MVNITEEQSQSPPGTASNSLMEIAMAARQHCGMSMPGPSENEPTRPTPAGSRSGEGRPRSDHELMRAARRRDMASLQELARRYGNFVLAAAERRLGAESPNSGDGVIDAELAARAVFLAFVRRLPRLPARTPVAPWLFNTTRIVCRPLQVQPGGGLIARWLRGVTSLGRTAPTSASTAVPHQPVGADPPHSSGAARLRDQLAPALDEAIDRLPTRQRRPVILHLLGHGPESMAHLLGSTRRTISRRLERGLGAVTRRLRRKGIPVAPAELRELSSSYGAVGRRRMPEHWETSLPVQDLSPAASRMVSAMAGRALRWLAWARWWRRLAIGGPAGLLVLVVLAGAFWAWDARTGHSRSIAWFLTWSAKRESWRVPGIAEPARAWAPPDVGPSPGAATVRDAADVYRTTNIWLAHLIFTPAEWAALEPERIEPLPFFLQPDGTALLRNPVARRSGLAGVLGFDFPWSRGHLELGGRRFPTVAVRIKGNGTYLGSLHGDKLAFKVDLNRFVRGQKLGGGDELNFNNLVNDFSCMSDALGYEFCRAAGVPAPRTAYAYLSVSVRAEGDSAATPRPLGLYVMVEPVDAEFALDRFGSSRTPVFKPVTYELFQDLGDDWAAYADIYDLKTEATPAQRRRVMEFARLVTTASDDEFARRLDEFLDLDAFARFLACQVLLSNYDGPLSTGQNFHLYLDPVTDRFGFIPWDLDLAWGGFFLLGTPRQRERASIWHPWVGSNRFLERVFAVDAFRTRYRSRLESLLAGPFQPAGLHRRIDELAGVLRDPVAAESDFRRRKFEEAVSALPAPLPASVVEHGANRPATQLKQFISRRARSVRRQLDGESQGVVLERGRRENR